jgi:hypothetical protein
MEHVADFFASHFTNVASDPQGGFKMSVSWGQFGGKALPSGVLGESGYSLYAASYSQLQTGFGSVAAAETANGSQAVNIPASDPFSGSNQKFMITAAEVHALHVPISPVGAGSVGFTSTANTFFFDPSHPVTGEYDFMGVAAHEMSEVLGRITLNGTIVGNGAKAAAEYTPLDLFNYGGNFSVDGGATSVQQFNTSSQGDQGDWATIAPPDAFDASPPMGVDLPFSYADYLAMEAVGYSGNFTYDISVAQTTIDWNAALGYF